MEFRKPANMNIILVCLIVHRRTLGAEDDPLEIEYNRAAEKFYHLQVAQNKRQVPPHDKASHEIEAFISIPLSTLVRIIFLNPI